MVCCIFIFGALAAGGLFPTRLMPDAVEVPLVHLLIHRTVYGNLPRFSGVLELTMIPFRGIQVPSVVFKHLDDLFRFICLHISSIFKFRCKGNKNNTILQIFKAKSIRFDIIFNTSGTKKSEPPKKFGKNLRKGAIFSLFFSSARYLFIKKVTKT